MPTLRNAVAAGSLLRSGSALPAAARAAGSTCTDFNADACAVFSQQEDGGSEIEWRSADGAPFSAMLRYNFNSGLGDGKALGDMILVAKVGTEAGPSCPVALVDVSAVEQPNGVARGAAAFAPSFDCGTDKPVAIRGSNSLAAGFSRAAAEGR